MNISIPSNFSGTKHVQSGWKLYLASAQNATELMRILSGKHEVKHENYISYHSQK